MPANGTFVGNPDIAPGTYRTGGGPNCYGARLKNLNTSDVIDNSVSDGHQVVGILPTDTALVTRGCGTWTKIGSLRAIGSNREVHHRGDVAEIDASRAQRVVDVVGNLLRRPAIPPIGTNVVCHQDDVAVFIRRPGEPLGAHLDQESIIDGVGRRNRSGGHQGGADHQGGGESDQPAG
jgi:hypothetical protein